MRALSLAFALLWGTAVLAQGKSLSMADEAFVKAAGQANLSEIRLGELARAKGSTEQIRATGKTMVDDHHQVGDTLHALALREGFTLPTEVSAEQKAAYDRLAALSGAEFDRAFLDQMKSDHREAVGLFEKEANEGRDPGLKGFAQSTLPELHQHQQLVNRPMNRM